MSGLFADCGGEFFADKKVFDSGSMDDGRGDTAQGDACIADLFVLAGEHKREIDNRDGLSFTQAKFEEEAAARLRENRDADLTEQFVASELSSAHALIELAEEDEAISGAATQDEFSIKGEEGRDGVVSRRGGEQVAC